MAGTAVHGLESIGGRIVMLAEWLAKPTKWLASRNAGRGRVMPPKSTPTPETSQSARAQATFASQKLQSEREFDPGPFPVSKSQLGWQDISSRRRRYAADGKVLSNSSSTAKSQSTSEMKWDEHSSTHIQESKNYILISRTATGLALVNLPAAPPLASSNASGIDNGAGWTAAGSTEHLLATASMTQVLGASHVQTVRTEIFITRG
ncbi:hypothetical protein DFH09DRAFT_1105058 [Mycena vulgaris]|nr:hypothetical protein DFH09DRAFT_1105058 [Mycena vulgaris]